MNGYAAPPATADATAVPFAPMPMSKAELESKHLAELHELAAGEGVPRYRLLRREELVEELLVRSAADKGARPAEDEKEREPASRPRRRRRRRTEDDSDETADRSPAQAIAEEERPAEAEAEQQPASETEEEVEEETATVSGVLDVLSQGHGFVRLAGLEPSPDDVYISASQIRRCELRPGDQLSGPARGPRRGERHPALVRVDSVNDDEPTGERSASFEELTPVLPRRRLPLNPDRDDVLVRATDLLTPLSYGHRVLVNAAPRSGRTTLLRGLVRAISASEEPIETIVLLVDERPEEVTEWKRQVPGIEIAAAPADLDSAAQMRHAELALARAKRRAEAGADVVLVIDSLTRLGFAAHDPAAVKRFFGAGRELEEDDAGSLTVIATVLTETEDGDGVMEAVKTTENATLALDPSLAAAGIVPAIDASRCSAFGEESLRGEELAAWRRLCGELRTLDPAEAAGLLRERIESTASNSELLGSL